MNPFKDNETLEKCPRCKGTINPFAIEKLRVMDFFIWGLGGL